MFTELYREEKREEGDRGGQEDKGGIKRRETDQPVISFLSVLHRPEHTKRFTELGREEKRGREEIEATWWRKRRVQRGRDQSSQ